jgi:hypothetical protein
VELRGAEEDGGAKEDWKDFFVMYSGESESRNQKSQKK